MNVRNHLAGEEGFSLMEVLIGATIFITGFAILAGSIDRGLYRLPVREDLAAVSLTESAVAEVWAGDTTTLDSLVDFGDITLRLRRAVVRDSTVTSCTVTITKAHTDQVIMRTVYEVLASEQ